MLQDPEQLACDLYAEGVVPEKAVDDVNVIGIADKQKRMKLLSFVKDNIAVEPTRLHKLVQILKKQPPMVEVAERLEETYREYDQLYIRKEFVVATFPPTTFQALRPLHVCAFICKP